MPVCTLLMMYSFYCLFGLILQSFEKLTCASEEDLALCPGLGPQKVRILQQSVFSL